MCVAGAKNLEKFSKCQNRDESPYQSFSQQQPYTLVGVCVCVCVCARRLQDLRCEGGASCSGAGTPQVVSSSVRSFAYALSHIEQGIERRLLKPPLGECAEARKVPGHCRTVA